jgi:hypothetical protein
MPGRPGRPKPKPKEGLWTEGTEAALAKGMPGIAGASMGGAGGSIVLAGVCRGG